MKKNILIVAAHPDDEVLGCGGTIAKHVTDGDKVYVLFMTNGVGSRDASSKEIRDRWIAAQNAADILGIASIQQLDFPDNKMDTVALLNIVQPIEEVIDKLQPEIIYTHFIGDLNIDHQVTHKAVMTACRPQPGFCVKKIYAFEVLSSTEWSYSRSKCFTPCKFFDISKYMEIKLNALSCYQQEIRSFPHARSYEMTRYLSKSRGGQVGLDAAEAFEIIREIVVS